MLSSSIFCCCDKNTESWALIKKRGLWRSVLEAGSLRSGDPICLVSDEVLMVDGITTAGACVEEITWWTGSRGLVHCDIALPGTNWGSVRTVLFPMWW